ncbi:Hemerythrin HHE cation binding protein [Candidatus Saccharibacteria bacterium RAAC3_TM7_1]|nr:Hemerythrin HHE cation binding protein [Candidatus Saccharibacteria bacterium RAAC3_TM7_1]
MRITEPIRTEHKELIPEIDKLKQTAEAIGRVPSEQLAAQIDERLNFLHHHLLPHARQEEEILYPAVARAMGSSDATRTMSRDHQAVKQLTQRLQELRNNFDDNQAREVLYGLYTLVSVHFAKEEEIYLTLLDERLSESEAAELFHQLEHAGHHSGHTH